MTKLKNMLLAVVLSVIKPEVCLPIPMFVYLACFIFLEFYDKSHLLETCITLKLLLFFIQNHLQ